MIQFFKSQSELNAKHFWLALTLITTLAILLRLPTLATRSLWIDETYSAWFASRSFIELWTSVPQYETHPPMYYTLLKVWSIFFGTSELGLRSLSVVASVMSVLLLGASARLVGAGGTADRVALLGALLLAFNASSIEFSQQARPYALQTLTASIAVLCSFVLLASPARDATCSGSSYVRRVWPWAAGLGFATGCTLWLHNTGFFIALGIWTGLTLSVLIFERGNKIIALLVFAAAGILALLVWSPNLSTFLMQSTALSSLSFWLRFVPSSLPDAWIAPMGGLKLAVLGILLAVPCIVRLWRVRPSFVCHLLTILLVAPLLMAAYSYFAKPVFIARLFVWYSPLLMAVLACGVFALPLRWRVPTTVITIALSALSALSFYKMPTEDWRDMVAKVETRLQPGDIVLALPNHIQIPILYYGSGTQMALRTSYLPAPFPSIGLNRTYIANLGVPAIDAEDAERVKRLASSSKRIWLIDRGTNLYDPQGLIVAAITTHMRLVEKLQVRGMRVTVFERQP